jgi:endoglucanase
MRLATALLLLGVATLMSVPMQAAGTASSTSLPASTKFFAPGPSAGAKKQRTELLAAHDKTNAALVDALASTAHAVWITGGTAHDTQVEVRKTVSKAADQGQLPVFAAYNIPGRDCGGLSAGGATTLAAYETWIDAFAAGLGPAPAIVILEPDSLGLLPSNCGAGFPFNDTDRYAELNYAVDRFGQQPNVLVYLDGTHSAWLNVHDISTRLINAGVARAQGFFLNVSNYQFAANSVQYGTWISKCIARIQVGNNDCPDQYWNGGPHPAMIADLLGEWTGVALNPYGEWSDTSTTPSLNTSGENLRYSSTTGVAHFVVDTSRDGLGPWNPATSSHSYSDAQDWCNPPGRGAGISPTANTGNSLLDAYLWVKVPGESDGTCARGAAAGSVDPEWGIVDPAAGQWFPQQALQLAQLASPALLP